MVDHKTMTSLDLPSPTAAFDRPFPPDRLVLDYFRRRRWPASMVVNLWT
jgi:hypothetical protein